MQPTTVSAASPRSLGLLVLITVLIVLQSTPVLGWLVP